MKDSFCANASIERVTDHAEANEQMLYFTASSLTQNDEHLVFLSDRTGHANLFARHLPTGREVQLSHSADSFMKSAGCPAMSIGHGIGKNSSVLHGESGRVFYLQDSRLHVATLDGVNRVLGKLPDNEVLSSCTDVSRCGRYWCVATVDAAALTDAMFEAGEFYKMDELMRREKLNSYLRVYDTETGELLIREPVPCGWANHVQFAPYDVKVILYNNDLSADSGIRRMWLWDGRQHHALRREEPGRSKQDWVCHEIWEPGGAGIIYHGSYANEGPAFIGRLDIKSGVSREIALPQGWKEYGHFFPGPAGMLISDGYYRDESIPQGDPKTPYGWSGKWISVLRVDWTEGVIRWIPQALTGSSWRTQDEHPHPILDHAGQHIYFTSDRDGRRAVYRLKIVEPI